MGIHWEDTQYCNIADADRKHKTSIWLKNKSARNALLKVLTDFMSVCAEKSPEHYYSDEHRNIQEAETTRMRAY